MIAEGRVFMNIDSSIDCLENEVMRLSLWTLIIRIASSIYILDLPLDIRKQLNILLWLKHFVRQARYGLY